MKGTVYQSNLHGRIIGYRQSFIFRKEPEKPLKISIEEVVPRDGWDSGEKLLKTISYSHVELSNEQSRSFTFKRKKSDVPFPVCHFEVSQEDRTEIYIDLAQRRYVEPIKGPMLQPETTQSRGPESRVSDTNGAMNESRQVQITEMVLSPSGTVAIRGDRHEEIIVHSGMSLNTGLEQTNRVQACVPVLSNLPWLQIPGTPNDLPIFSELSLSDILKLQIFLDPDHILHKDWRMLAGKLGFTSTDVWNFQRHKSPTEALLFCAGQSGKLKSKVQLMQILEDMERLDARRAISN